MTHPMEAAYNQWQASYNIVGKNFNALPDSAEKVEVLKLLKEFTATNIRLMKDWKSVDNHPEVNELKAKLNEAFEKIGTPEARNVQQLFGNYAEATKEYSRWNVEKLPKGQGAIVYQHSKEEYAKHGMTRPSAPQAAPQQQGLRLTDEQIEERRAQTKEESTFVSTVNNIENYGNTGKLGSIPLVNVVAGMTMSHTDVADDIRDLYKDYRKADRELLKPHSKPYDYFAELETRANAIRSEINNVRDDELRNRARKDFDTLHAQEIEKAKWTMEKGNAYYRPQVEQAHIVPSSESAAKRIAAEAPPLAYNSEKKQEHAQSQEQQKHHEQEPEKKQGLFSRIFGKKEHKEEHHHAHKEEHHAGKQGHSDHHQQSAASGKKTTVKLDEHTSQEVLKYMQSMDSGALFNSKNKISADELAIGAQKHPEIAQYLQSKGIKFDGVTSYDIGDAKQHVANQQQQTNGRST